MDTAVDTATAVVRLVLMTVVTRTVGVVTVVVVVEVGMLMHRQALDRAVLAKEASAEGIDTARALSPVSIDTSRL